MSTTTITTPAELTVRAARDHYLTSNGFSMTEYSAPTFAFSLLGRKLNLPNPPARQAAIARHDLHHALLGFGTDLAGEGEISVWELRAGCNTAFLWAINLLGTLMGLCVAPRRTLRAWRSARGCKTLYVAGVPYEAALDMRVLDLRRRLGIPDEGVVAAKLHAPVAEAARA